VGYAGPIALILGLDIQGKILGVRVLAHTETPGLGDRIEIQRDDWILSFNGRSLGNPPAERWAVKKDGGDFDQFSGATITPPCGGRRNRGWPPLLSRSPRCSAGPGGRPGTESRTADRRGHSDSFHEPIVQD